MVNNCKICSEEYEKLEDFHKHLKTHKVTQKKYYLTHYPKKDPFDGKDIEYRNPIQYLDAIYNCPANLKNHLKSVTKKEGQKICEEIVSQRAVRKGLKFSPSQVESKSLNIPPVSFMVKYLDDYKESFNKYGLETRYTYCDSILGFKGTTKKILIDTREQTPILFENSMVKKLDYGDYTLEDDTSVVIERKSLGDFIGTLSKGYDRFIREIQGGIVNDCYFVVLVEAPIETALTFHKISKFNKFCRSNGGFIFHKLREITEEYRNIQFLFVEDREESKYYIERILNFGKPLIPSMDLQYYYDLKII